MDTREIALDMHRKWQGKIEIKSRATVENREELSIAYTPGVAQPCLEIARDKAFTSAAMRMSTEELAGLCKPGGSLYGLQHTNGGRIVIFGGGVPLVEGNRLVGGFGVSGGTAEQDTNLANYALKVFSAGIREEYSR